MSKNIKSIFSKVEIDTSDIPNNESIKRKFDCPPESVNKVFCYECDNSLITKYHDESLEDWKLVDKLYIGAIVGPPLPGVFENNYFSYHNVKSRIPLIKEECNIDSSAYKNMMERMNKYKENNHELTNKMFIGATVGSPLPEVFEHSNVR